MGISESKQLAENVLVACQHAEFEGKTRLDDSSFWNWKDETIIKAVKSICQHIPQDIRGSPRRSNLQRAITRKNAAVKIPQVVEDIAAKREILFPNTQALQCGKRTSEYQHSREGSCFPVDYLVDSIAGLYKLITRVEKDHDLCKIRLRLLYVMFYRLKQWVEPGSQRQYYSATNFIAEVILNDSLSSDPLDKIHSTVRGWIGKGERYERLANDLGGLGVLYILPDYGGETLWTREVPKTASNPNRISMLNRLKQEGIVGEAVKRGLHECAEGEINKILGPLQRSLQEVLERRVPQGQLYSRATPSQLSQNSETCTVAQNPIISSASRVLDDQHVQPQANPQQTFNLTSSESLATTSPSQMQSDQATNMSQLIPHPLTQNMFMAEMDMPQINAYGHFEQPIPHLSTQNSLIGQTDMPQINAYGHFAQPIPHLSTQNNFIGQTNMPQISAYGYFEQTIPHPSMRNNYAAQIEMPQVSTLGYHPEPLHHTVDGAQSTNHSQINTVSGHTGNVPSEPPEQVYAVNEPRHGQPGDMSGHCFHYNSQSYGSPMLVAS
ncbi:uncharacterized protein ATNIH1004_011787 [Aspergillus tanneri]|uniref:Uncharacterized protein n=1 Tax=Aspergillus tanneri TaxID=1220188 RepID=A0A5M9M4L8_9EURO|nr:uncharacterized protein ATNIH1004_011787 [Aspergillus tanneri]KAA8641651.1 hypothetical protein ATNIH1004_011787 [Aspergillus tanneri]